MKRKPNELEPPVTLPLSKFTRSKNTLVAEVSDFGIGDAWAFRIYNDAADIGIAIRSEKTGNVVRFNYSSTDYSDKGPDADVAGWRFKPLDPAGWVEEVLLIND